MSTNDQSRDPRLSRNDPRLANKKFNPNNKKPEEKKKRIASQSPAGSAQPLQQKPKPTTVNGTVSPARDPRRRPSVDNATPAGSRRNSFQSNGANANLMNALNSLANANAAANGNGNGVAAPSRQPAPAAFMGPPTQTAPVASMGNGQNPGQDSVLSTLPAKPPYHTLLLARADITGKLMFAGNQRDCALPELNRARKGYEAMSIHFESFPATKEEQTRKLDFAQRKYDKANNLYSLMQDEATRVEELLQATAAANPVLKAMFEAPGSSSVAQLTSDDSEMRKELELLKQQVGSMKQVSSGSEVQKEVAELKEEVQKLKSDLAASRNRAKQEAATLEKKLDAIRNDLDEGKKDQPAELAELSAKIKQLEEKADKDDNLVVFSAVPGPEQEPSEDLMPTIALIRSEIEALRMATEAHKKQLDNLTTDEVVAQMVQVMSTTYFPDARNCQAAADKYYLLMNQYKDRLDDMDARLARVQHGGASADVAQLRTDLDNLKGTVQEHTGALGRFDDKVSRLSNDVGDLQGGQEEIMRQVLPGGR